MPNNQQPDSSMLRILEVVLERQNKYKKTNATDIQIQARMKRNTCFKIIKKSVKNGLLRKDPNQGYSVTQEGTKILLLWQSKNLDNIMVQLWRTIESIPQSSSEEYKKFTQQIYVNILAFWASIRKNERSKENIQAEQEARKKILRRLLRKPILKDTLP
jgi:predicted transcriptional regulator